MDKPIDIEALECQHKEVTGGRHWYTVESPWRDESMPTYAVEGDEDPHAGTPVLDTVDVEEWADDADRQRKIAEADARLSLAVDCVNAIPALLAEIKHLRERVKAERTRLAQFVRERGRYYDRLANCSTLEVTENETRADILDAIAAEIGKEQP